MLRKFNTVFVTVVFILVASFTILPTIASSHSGLPGSDSDRDLFHAVSAADFNLTPGQDQEVVSVQHVEIGSYAVTFAGSAKATHINTPENVTCFVTVNGSRQSAGQTTVIEGTFQEQNAGDTIPFTVTDVVTVQVMDGTVTGVCHDNTTGTTSTATILKGAQITLVKGRCNDTFSQP